MNETNEILIKYQEDKNSSEQNKKATMLSEVAV